MRVKTDVEREFERDPAAFMARYAVYPSDYVGDAGEIYDKSKIGLAVDDKLQIERRANMIAYARLDSIPYNKLGGKKNSFAAKFHAARSVAGEEAGYIPMWFLPWWSNAITSIRIPPKIPPRPDKPDTRRLDPDFFFTASINGCSVFVHGDPRTPIVSHAGTTDPRSRQAMTMAPNDKGERVLSPNQLFFPTGNARTHWTSVFERHYGDETGASSIHTGDYKNYLSSENTREAMEYDKFLRDKSGRELRIDEVQSSGSVFGSRDPAGNWSFYLQKNVEITVTKLRKKMHLFKENEYLPKKVATGDMVTPYVKGVRQPAVPQLIEQTVQMSIPIQVMKFFPGDRNANAGSVMLDKNTLKAMVQQAVG